jgi:uncharacterized protein (DUF4415 family)
LRARSTLAVQEQARKIGNTATFVPTARLQYHQNRKQPNPNGRPVKEQYDFGKAKRGPVMEAKGKTRTTIYIDDDVLEAFRKSGDEQSALRLGRCVSRLRFATKASGSLD